MAQQAATPSVLGRIRTSKVSVLAVSSAVVFVIALLMSLLIRPDTDAFLLIVLLAIFALLAGTTVRVIAANAETATLWTAAVLGGVGVTLLYVIGKNTGGDLGAPFGDATEAALSAPILGVGNVLAAIAALSVVGWGKR